MTAAVVLPKSDNFRTRAEKCGCRGVDFKRALLTRDLPFVAVLRKCFVRDALDVIYAFKVEGDQNLFIHIPPLKNRVKERKPPEKGGFTPSKRAPRAAPA